jgi:2-methylfumaryl-CoA isomerase
LGAELRIALSDVAFATVSHLGILAEGELLGRERPSIGNHIYGAFGRDFATADGRRLMVAAISLAQWSALISACAVEREVEALGASLGLDLNDEAQRYEAREAIAALLEPWFAARPLKEISERFDEYRVCWGVYRGVLDLLGNDARVSTRNPIFSRIDTPGVGTHLAAGTPVRASQLPAGTTGPAPLLGTHTDAVLAEILGLDSPTIGRLHDRRIVAGPDTDPTARG